jgi:hypothetical protein
VNPDYVTITGLRKRLGSPTWYFMNKWKKKGLIRPDATVGGRPLFKTSNVPNIQARIEAWTERQALGFMEPVRETAEVKQECPPAPSAPQRQEPAAVAAAQERQETARIAPVQQQTSALQAGLVKKSALTFALEQIYRRRTGYY